MASIVDELTTNQISKLRVQQNDTTPVIVMTEKINGAIHVPFYYGMKSRQDNVNTAHSTMSSTKFTGTLRPYQITMRQDLVTVLNKNKCAILSSYVGAGKTIISINLATKIKLKTLVVVNRVLLATQWENSIKEHTNATSVTLLTKKVKECNTDFAIVNGINISKIDKDVLDTFGMVIIDECHALMSGKVGMNLLRLTPKYLLGLSATASRDDGFQKMFDLFFGGEKNIVFTKLNHPHNVYPVFTNLKYKTVKNMFTNQIDYNQLLNQLSVCPDRNQVIVDTVCNTNGVFLILVKRIEHGELLTRLFADRGKESHCLFGKTMSTPFTSDILIATYSKAGIGFDCPRLNTLVIAAPVKNYFIQYLGRVMRTKDSVPVIYDFVDSVPILQNQWRCRAKVYTEHGGKIIKTKK
jgi:hypothetical protein